MAAHAASAFAPETSRGFPSLDRAVLVREPYPHLVMEDALPADLADALVALAPPVEAFARDAPIGSNVRFALPSAVALADPRASAGWKSALREVHAGLPRLLSETLRRLGPELAAAYPDFTSRYCAPERLVPVPRETRDKQRHEIGMDVQMVVNSPALEAGSRVRGAHLDWPDKLISALLYLRAPGDDSTGGELELYEALEPIAFDARNNAPLDRVRVVRRYPYRHNLLVLPINSPAAIHGVTPRGATAWPRYHLHFVGEVVTPLFETPR